MEHLYDGIVQGEADAVLAASIFHYRTHSIREVKQYLYAKGVPVRLV
jgi:cyclase